MHGIFSGYEDRWMDLVSELVWYDVMRRVVECFFIIRWDFLSLLIENLHHKIDIETPDNPW